MRRFGLILSAALTAIVLSGCNTVAGVGKDVEKAGEAIQRKAGK